VSGLRETRVGRILLWSLLGLGLAVLMGLVILWPTGEDPELSVLGIPRDTVTAEATEVDDTACSGGQVGTCAQVRIKIKSGEREGETGTISQSVPQEVGLDPEISVGDKLRVIPPPGESESESPIYIFAGFDRSSPMLVLGVLFAALVILFGRLRGALSLLGLAISLVVILVFIVPAILHGEPALAVAIFGSLAVMLVTILLAHGLTLKSLGALMGTTASLLLVALLAVIYTSATHLTGFSSTEALNLSFQTDLDLRGLLLAGMVIGALGVLDDITVSQSSTVLALRSANPDLDFRSLYGRATAVGRDHASAAVNTLVFAYAGAALPVLLIFSGTGLDFGDAVNLEIVAKEVVAMLVGSIGLIAAVPLTTALTAWLSLQIQSDEIPAGEPHVH
jgi:uncharacterized membrane protein